MGRRLSNRKSVKKKEKERNKTTSSVRQARLGTVFFFFFASQATNTCSTKRSFLSQWHEPMMRTQKNKLPLLYNHQARCVNELKRACGKEKKMLSLPDPDEKAGNNEKDATLGSKESAGKGNHGTETLGRQKARRRQHSRSHAKLCS